ncbi:MAG: hypothetical protein BroJett038_20370 [Chloroflexota bacterium]|nr:MAG: hypothetical protein BroJett038_20370 [Chloroflexota bacterium]
MSEANISLTIYNQGTALVRDRRTVELAEGLNTLEFRDVTALIDATSVTLQAAGAAVLEQNFLFDLVGADALLRRYLEQTIELTTEDGARFVGTLLNAPSRGGDPFNNQTSELILQQADGQVAVVALDKIRDIRFPALPGGLITRPTLRWLLHSQQAGALPVELTYLTGGMNWSADYNLLLAGDSRRFDLNGWVTLTNTSGTTFHEAQVKLVAGEVKRIEAERAVQRRAFALGMAMAAPAEPQIEQREIFEYQLYEIKRPVTVAHNETKQVEFITARGVLAERFYVFRVQPPFTTYGPRPYVEPVAPGASGAVQVWLEFSTGEQSGLGADLPAGRLRAYQLDADGSAVLIGESKIKHTPKGENVKIELGKAFDLVGERRQTHFQQVRKNIIEESYAIQLRSRKDSEPVQIRVLEALFRWRSWKIVQHSHPYTVEDAGTIEFRADLPPGGETTITYTVRYEWAD